MPGISFDRAAGYYDATRGFSEETVSAVTDVLTQQMAGRGPALEVGVGTGRISLPLRARGMQLVGTDLSMSMLAELVDKAGGGPAVFPLSVSDATALPFADRSFGSVLFCHVLHLIPDWALAVDEAERVLRPGGALVVDFGGGAAAPWNERTRQIMSAHGVDRVRPGASSPDVVVAHLGSRASVRALAPVPVVVRRSLAQDLSDWRNQIHSWNWSYTPEQMGRVADVIEAAAPGEGWDLDEVVDIRHSIQWWVFDLAP